MNQLQEPFNGYSFLGTALMIGGIRSGFNFFKS
jgi:hypothetical protein